MTYAPQQQSLCVRSAPNAATLKCILFGLILLAQCAGANAGVPKLFDVEYAIISAAIVHGLGEQSEKIIIDEITTGEAVNVFDPAPSDVEPFEQLGTTAVALREWSRTNRDRQSLTEQLSINREYILLSANDRLKIFNDTDPAANWRQFHARFPGSAGIIRVSRPGIDDVVGAALLYLEFECGADCGSGRLINLVRDDRDEWRVTDGTLIWITSPE